MRFVVILLAAALLAGGAGCSDSDAEESATDTSRLTSAELGWIRAYAAWSIAIYDGELGPQPGRRLVEVCEERFDEVGDPPTERLEPGAERAADTCPLLAHRGMHRRALDAIDDADDLLSPLLRQVQPLRLEHGPTDGSRADLDLSAWAARELEFPAEVRCWDADEWRRVVLEDDAWSDERTDPDELYGWAESSVDRIHMRLDQCNLIAEARANDAGRSRTKDIEIADALGTLFHEMEHLFDPDASESEVECEVLYYFSDYAMRLGWGEQRSLQLSRLYRNEVYPEQPDEYISDCDE